MILKRKIISKKYKIEFTRLKKTLRTCGVNIVIILKSLKMMVEISVLGSL